MLIRQRRDCPVKYAKRWERDVGGIDRGRVGLEGAKLDHHHVCVS